MAKMKPLKELNLTNRFLFDEVMSDPMTHRDALCIIFNRDIPLLEYNETEKEGRLTPLIRSIRMDVYAMDEENIVYNTEMQNEWKSDLAKRSRYYQALVDTGLLEPGIPNYNILNESYIIIIMSFDFFGQGKYVYTFKPSCQEVPGLVLNDGAVRIFLNTKGKNDDEVSKELVDFLHYLEETTDEKAKQIESDRIKRIHERVCKVKINEEVGVKYMQAWEEKYYAKEEGREEGREEILKELVEKMFAKGWTKARIVDELELEEALVEAIFQKMKESASE
ncbi:MAG: Rpn family recombination-promoting nuclease/putative transposase [Tyzzerella sp.]|nr:Rpn family recombination-promoting nuclease/putative transposase [Tyzzerella sp.]